MTRDDIIRMAREAGHSPAQIDIVCRFAAVLDDFAALVAAAEREACAKVCEQQKDRWVDGSDQWGNPCPARLRATPSSCAAAIRARS